MQRILAFLLASALLTSCGPEAPKKLASGVARDSIFQIRQTREMIQVFRRNENIALVTQNIRPDFRPYLHPILSPGTEVSLTEYSPGHHPHQTGLYWGITRLNGTGAEKEELSKWFYDPDKPEDIKKKIGRDFFHNPGEDHWKQVSASVLKSEGLLVSWKTVYHLLDEAGKPVLKESQTWTFSEKEGKFLMGLEWEGEALEDITINEFDYGGLFLRMPWKEGTLGNVVNAARQQNANADGQRAMWVDAGIKMDGMEALGHMAIFDHPNNQSFPQPWRVDSQLGFGPVLAKSGDLQIKKGEVKLFQHQIVAYAGELNPLEMNELWGAYAGDDGMYNTASLWGIAQQEGRDAKLLSPQEAVAEMTLKKGYKVNVFASEPMITQPMAFCWDDRGRMWIAENRDYESRVDGFSGSGDSRILILEDTDHDGVTDTGKVFLEGIPFPSAIAVGHGGLFLGAPPNLLFVPDANQDDQADLQDMKILLTGWGIRDRHETINSFHWGPDGWLYGLEGFATSSVIRKPKGKGRIYKHREAFPKDLLEAEGVEINGGVWRYHPLKDEFEVVAHGFSNPWGIDYDSKGQLFISACVIPHLFHIMPGGIYHRQGGQHFNPYVYEDIKTIVDHPHRSAHGGARIYQSDAFPAEEQGRLFMANIHEHAVLSDLLTPKGSGFKASHGDDFLLANNAQWIGFSMEIGPEGGLYVLDWHDADICGNEVVNKETGRVFRIMPETNHAKNWQGRFDDLNAMSDLALADLQMSKSNWHAARARVILQYRAAGNPLKQEALNRLKSMMAKDHGEDLRLRALWTLWITGSLTPDQLIPLLKDKQEYMRSWAIQFLTEDRRTQVQTVKALTDLAKNEPSAVVRRYLAGAMQRLEEKDRWAIASSLVKQGQDSEDPNIPYMLWFGIEPLVAGEPEKALRLARESKIPSITEKIARRLVDAGQLAFVTSAAAEAANGQEAWLRGTLAGIEGNATIKEPDSWQASYKHLQTIPNLATLADEIARHFGNAESAEKMMALLKDPSASLSQQGEAIQSMALHQRKELEALLPELLENPDLRKDAIRAVAAYNNRELAELLIEKYPKLKEDEKQEALLTLASRPSYGEFLAGGIKAATIPRKDIPAYVVLQLRAILGNGFVEIWGPIDGPSNDLQGAYANYQRLLSAGALSKADLANGADIYRRTCSACHVLHGEGGKMGPDLTGSNRTNTAYLLSNILNPSGDVQDDYKLVVVTTRDGRTYSGNVLAENERNLTLRIVGQEPVVLSKSEIQSRDVTSKSMMPDGLLQNLSDPEVVDLFAYLKALDAPVVKQVSR